MNNRSPRPANWITIGGHTRWAAHRLIIGLSGVYERSMNTLKQWLSDHPNLSAWFVLAVGMVILVVLAGRDVGLAARQWFWLVVITVLVAGACIWIISWGDDDEEEETAES